MTNCIKQYQLKGKFLHDGIVEQRIKWNILVCCITRFIMGVIAGILPLGPIFMNKNSG